MALFRRPDGKLRLTVNETKSAVTNVFGRKFLSYSLWWLMAVQYKARSPSNR